VSVDEKQRLVIVKGPKGAARSRLFDVFRGREVNGVGRFGYFARHGGQVRQSPAVRRRRAASKAARVARRVGR
jgi:hypothetical protein